MKWLARQLFGAQAAVHLADKVSSAVAAYLLSQPDATIDQIKAVIVSRADSLIGSVLTFVPAWARPLLMPILDSAIVGLVESAYRTLTKQGRPISGHA